MKPLFSVIVVAWLLLMASSASATEFRPVVSVTPVVINPGLFSPDTQDTDGDGVVDADEERAGTLAKNCDSDGDGLSDGVELGKIKPEGEELCHGLQAAGTNFRKPNLLDPKNPDSDSDGLSDGEEDLNGNGWLDPDETDPTVADTDRDGIDDGAESLLDFDQDGVADFDYRTIKGEGACNPPQTMTDLDCDGIPNARDDDADNDGCPDAQEEGWVDVNVNGIPDLYDAEIKACPEPATSGGSSGGGSQGDKTPSEPEHVSNLFPSDGQDGAACTLKPRATRGSASGAMACLILLVLGIATSRRGSW